MEKVDNTELIFKELKEQNEWLLKAQNEAETKAATFVTFLLILFGLFFNATPYLFDTIKKILPLYLSEEKTIAIIITPPFTLMFFFVIGVLLLIFGLFAGLNSFRGVVLTITPNPERIVDNQYYNMDPKILKKTISYYYAVSNSKIAKQINTSSNNLDIGIGVSIFGISLIFTSFLCSFIFTLP